MTRAAIQGRLLIPSKPLFFDLDIVPSALSRSGAIEYLLEHCTQDPTLKWVRLDGFPRVQFRGDVSER
jgi:hypothetical protein